MTWSSIKIFPTRIFVRICQPTRIQTRKVVFSQRLSWRKFPFSKLFSGFQWNLVLRVKRRKIVGTVFRDGTFTIWILSVVQCVKYWDHLSTRFPHSLAWRQGLILSPKDSVLNSILKAEWWLSPNGAAPKLRVRVRQIALYRSTPVWKI
jgi:hypothetical protein